MQFGLFLLCFVSGEDSWGKCTFFFGKSAYEQLIKSLDRDKIVEMSRRNIALRGQFGIMPHHLFYLVGRSLHVSRTAMLATHTVNCWAQYDSSRTVSSCRISVIFFIFVVVFHGRRMFSVSFFNVFHGRKGLFLAFIVIFHGRKEVIVKKSFVFHGRRIFFLHFFVSSMEDGRFSSVQPLSAVVEALRPFDFLVSEGARGWRFTSLYLKSSSSLPGALLTLIVSPSRSVLERIFSHTPSSI